MGVPSPWASPLLGDPAFARIKRLVCLGAILFPIEFTTRHTSKRALGCSVTEQPVSFATMKTLRFFDVVILGMV